MSNPAPTGDATPLLSVVVPLFNEEANVEALHGRLRDSLATTGEPYELVLVNDGSRDATAILLDRLHEADRRVVVIHLSRNFGHQAAVSAGLDFARGRAVAVMDGDLQDPPEVLPRFLERWRDGVEVVYAIRRDRKETAFKRLGYFAFYRIMNAISDLDIPLDSGDFCLMDRRVVDALTTLPERMRFVRGLRTFVGFRQEGLEYERAPRTRGRSKYTFRALMSLAISGLISFSSYPLRIVTYLGIATAAMAAVMMAWVFHDAFTNGTAPRGWASVIVTVLFMGSIQMVGMGILGEYIRLIFLESKGRPSYIVGRFLSHDGPALPRVPSAPAVGDALKSGIGASER
ncbi:glycosyltransferase family 2 protein [Aquisphaera insulae]|uniref:glycosyltransferase family 2 protein n=1 Tax=Aquisphaera insulae TaxID=2712864 RepID=UPI00202FB548|nr:glycosyltransferase family 2 protein [Aquisphaera insulae]